MQESYKKEVRIISNWQMYKDCGVSIRFIDDFYAGLFFVIYCKYSVKEAYSDALEYFTIAIEEKNEDYIQKGQYCLKMANYLIQLGCLDDEEILIAVD